MNPERIKVLKFLSAGQVNSASTLINRHIKCWGHYASEEFTATVLAPMVADGLLVRLQPTKRLTLYSITSMGLAALEMPVVPLEVAPPRTISFQHWDGRMQWDVASQRGDHRHIASAGVAC